MEEYTYAVSLGCISCGAIRKYGDIPGGTIWFDYFKDGVECNVCQRHISVDRATLWWSNLSSKLGPFNNSARVGIKEDTTKPTS